MERVLTPTKSSSAWSAVLGALAPKPPIIQWRLVGGVTFWMYAPAKRRLTATDIAESTVRYSEIAELTIGRDVQLGGESVGNDLDDVVERLKDIPQVVVERLEGEVRVRLAD
jgi:hypothetical protein